MAKTRHKSPRTVMRYVKPGDEAVAEVTSLLGPPGALTEPGRQLIAPGYLARSSGSTASRVPDDSSLTDTPTLDDATTLKLCRLRYVGSAHHWQFAIYRDSHDDYDESVFPTGLLVGTCQQALDTARALYLNDPDPDKLTGVTTRSATCEVQLPCATVPRRMALRAGFWARRLVVVVGWPYCHDVAGYRG